MTVRDRPGHLEKLSYGAGNPPVTFPDFQPRPDATKTVLFLRTTQAGTLNVLRIFQGVSSQQIPDQSLTAAADEYTVLFDYPIVGVLRVKFTPTTGLAGTIEGWASYGGQGSAGR